MIALFTFLLLSNLSLFAQAPASLAGMTFDLTVTEATNNYDYCRGTSRLILNDKGDGYILGIKTCIGTGGFPDWRFTQNFSKLNSSTFRMNWIGGTFWDPGSYQAEPPDNLDLTHDDSATRNTYTTFRFLTSREGVYENNGSRPDRPRFARGNFKSYNGDAPQSFAHKIATIKIPVSNARFPKAGTYYIVTDSEQFTIINSQGTTISSGIYLDKMANRSTSMLTLFDAEYPYYPSGLIAFTFENTSAGNLVYHEGFDDVFDIASTNITFSADFSVVSISPPTISSHPQSQSVGVGQPATMSVTASGTGTLTYQWYRNGVALSQGTSSVVNIASVQLWHGGTYHVVVSNGAGEVTSSPATLTPVCSYSFSPGYTLLNYPGGTRQVNVTATGTCPWTASTTNSWIQITSGASGEGNGIVEFSVAPNDTAEPRNGFLNILGKTFIVAQRGDLVRTNIDGKTLLLTFESGYGDQPATGAFVTAPGGTGFRFVSRSTNSTDLTGTYLFSKASITTASISSELLEATLHFTNAISGTFTGTNHLGNATAGHFVLCATAPDFNGDAYADLVFQNTSAVLASWFMEGTSFLQSSLLRDGIPLASNQRAFALSDLNNDGHTDVVLRSTEGRLGAWLMNGTERLGAIVLRNGITAPPWRAFSTTDLRGNGQHDILFQHQDGRIAAWHFDQTNFIGATSLRGGRPIGVGWRAVGAGDFNGDLQADILLQHTTGKVAVGWMNAGEYIGAETLRNGWAPPAGLRVVGVGDFNGDGQTDILWQNSRNQLAVWIMNGKTFVSAMYLRNGAPVGAQWKVIGPK